MVEKKTPVGKPADDFIRIQDLWSMFVPKWYWFAISLFNPSRLTTSVISVGDFNVSNSLLMLVLDLKIPKSEKSFIALVEELLFELSLTRMAAVRV